MFLSPWLLVPLCLLAFIAIAVLMPRTTAALWPSMLVFLGAWWFFGSVVPAALFMGALFAFGAVLFGTVWLWAVIATKIEEFRAER